MKTVFTFLATILLTVGSLSAYAGPSLITPLPNALAEESAVFMGDNNLINSWVMGEVVCPELAMANAREGRVVVQFTVDKQGQPKDFVTKKDIGLGCGDAVIAAIERMPRWTPARSQGEAVDVSFVIAVDFQMY